MKFFMIVFEYLAGFVGLISTLFTLALGGLFGLCEIPRYLKIKSK